MSAAAAAAAPPAVVDALLTYLEVCIHALLYARGVYPAELFQRTSMYGCVAWMCRAPPVCEGLRRCLGDARALLLANAVESLQVPLLAAGSGAELARYVFDLDLLCAAPAPASAVDIDGQLAAGLRALQALECTPPAPPGTTWTVPLRAHLAGVEEPAQGRAAAAAAAAAAAEEPKWHRVDEAADAGGSGGGGGSGGSSSSSSSSSSEPHTVLRRRKPLKTVRFAKLYIALAEE